MLLISAAKVQRNIAIVLREKIHSTPYLYNIALYHLNECHISDFNILLMRLFLRKKKLILEIPASANGQ